VKIVRPVRGADLAALGRLADQAGTGMTSMPKDRDSQARRIDAVQQSFKATTFDDKRLDYLFVMEDLDTGEVVGTTGIKTMIGTDKPFYSYRLLNVTQLSHDPYCRVDTDVLQLTNEFNGAAEIGSLFLLRNHRRQNAGRVLATMRYLFMAAFPERFPETIIAEMRGWVDTQDRSPFWDAIGRHFFQMDFTQADELNGRGNSQFIADLMPKFPIYTALLPKDAQDVIGRPNDGAVPALKLLEREGFRFSGAVDIFDGGPTYSAVRPTIRSVRAAVQRPLAGTVDGGSSGDDDVLIAKDSLDGFAATLGKVVETDSGIWITADTARALDVVVGDTIRYVPLTAQ